MTDKTNSIDLDEVRKCLYEMVLDPDEKPQCRVGAARVLLEAKPGDNPEVESNINQLLQAIRGEHPAKG